MNQQQIGLFLKSLREEKKMTQEQLAEIVNVSNRTISRWENGKNLPDLSIIVQLSEIFDVKFSEIVNAKRESECESMEEKEKGAILQLAQMYRKEKYDFPKKFNWLLGIGFIGVVLLCLNINNELNQLSASLMAGVLTIALYLNSAYAYLGSKADGPLCGIGEKVFPCTYKRNISGVGGHLKISEKELRFYPSFLYNPKEKEFGFSFEEIEDINIRSFLLISKVIVIKAAGTEYRFLLEKNARTEILNRFSK